MIRSHRVTRTWRIKPLSFTLFLLFFFYRDSDNIINAITDEIVSIPVEKSIFSPIRCLDTCAREKLLTRKLWVKTGRIKFPHTSEWTVCRAGTGWRGRPWPAGPPRAYPGPATSTEDIQYWLSDPTISWLVLLTGSKSRLPRFQGRPADPGTSTWSKDGKYWPTDPRCLDSVSSILLSSFITISWCHGQGIGSLASENLVGRSEPTLDVPSALGLLRPSLHFPLALSISLSDADFDRWVLFCGFFFLVLSSSFLNRPTRLFGFSTRGFARDDGVAFFLRAKSAIVFQHFRSIFGCIITMMIRLFIVFPNKMNSRQLMHGHEFIHIIYLKSLINQFHGFFRVHSDVMINLISILINENNKFLWNLEILNGCDSIAGLGEKRSSFDIAALENF